ncbi:PspC domain-containing protein [Massilia sp. SR12]
MSVSEELKRLHELHQAGALSDEEFARAKEKLLQQGQASGDFATEFSSLRRARNDRWLGGVCGGIGARTGVESWIWRLVFALFTATFGFGLLIYLLLWIFVPEDEMTGI